MLKEIIYRQAFTEMLARSQTAEAKNLKILMRVPIWPSWTHKSRTMRTVLCTMLVLLTAGVSVPASAITHTRTSKVRRVRASHRFKIRFNPVFPGSHEMLVQQNVELDKLQLPRIYNDYELLSYELSQDLVPVSESDALKIAANLPENRRYCRPWTRDFLEDFSQAFYNEFHQPIQVNSLVRTVEQQHTLRRHNRFAAPEFGDTASTHLTGVTADLSRRGFTKAQYAWVRAYLMPLHEAGLIDPIEESQPVLHVVVYDRYSTHNTNNEFSLSEASEPGEFPLMMPVSKTSEAPPQPRP